MSVSSGDFHLTSLSLVINTGMYGVMTGPTGQGKTTLLESICGLREVSQGTIRLNRTDVTRMDPAERNIGYVPQDTVLFPHMTVVQQIRFPLKIRKIEPQKIQSRIAELANLLGIESLLDRKTQNLSGGESQRVAIARALSFEPDFLILDEPLSGLDPINRTDMQAALKSISKQEGLTVLHVSHQTDETNTVADIRFQLANGTVKVLGGAD
ncbi:MAG: ABC transporter ATP-binding protein [Planctomycetota bacterium]